MTVFYKDWSYSPGLILLGKIESGLDELSEKLESMSDDLQLRSIEFGIRKVTKNESNFPHPICNPSNLRLFR